MVQANERIFIIPLRKECLKVQKYRRAGRAIKAIKKYVAKHMKVADRDPKKVKLDVYFNNDIWFRGRKNHPSKVKVKALREGDLVRVDFVEIPEIVKFLKARHLKRHKKTDKKSAVKPTGVKPVEKTEEEKKEEIEKGKSVEKQNIKQAEAAVKAQKHTTKVKEPQIQRKALKK